MSVSPSSHQMSLTDSLSWITYACLAFPNYAAHTHTCSPLTKHFPLYIDQSVSLCSWPHFYIMFLLYWIWSTWYLFCLPVSWSSGWYFLNLVLFVHMNASGFAYQSVYDCLFSDFTSSFPCLICSLGSLLTKPVQQSTCLSACVSVLSSTFSIAGVFKTIWSKLKE